VTRDVIFEPTRHSQVTESRSVDAVIREVPMASNEGSGVGEEKDVREGWGLGAAMRDSSKNRLQGDF
jgi:hypothetical protein